MEAPRESPASTNFGCNVFTQRCVRSCVARASSVSGGLGTCQTEGRQLRSRRARSVLFAAALAGLALLASCGRPDSEGVGTFDTFDSADPGPHSYPTPGHDCAARGVEESVPYGGPDGEGLCVGVQRVSGASGPLVGAFERDAEITIGLVYSRCSVADATVSLNAVRLPARQGGEVFFGSTSVDTATVALTMNDGVRRRVSTVRLDGFPGITYFAIRVDDVDSIIKVEELTDRGAPVTKPQEAPPCE
jgi:hypothetical protein